MITRIEIDGFKSFVDFSMDVPPFLALLGPNGGGKSNFVDALAAMRDLSLRSSFETSIETGRGIPAELFHQREDGSRVSAMDVSLEAATVHQRLENPVGYRLRFEATYDAAEPAVQVKRVAVEDVSAGREEVETPGRDSRKRMRDLRNAEVHSWHFISPAPLRMRDRSLATDTGPLATDAGNLAAVLGRIAKDESAHWDLLADAVALIPGLRDVRSTQGRDYWEYELEFRGTGWITPRMASDGTLRILAILAAAHDPNHPGVLILDEVENGLHPSRLVELIRRLRNLVFDQRNHGELRKPLRQVIMTTHSPVVLSALYPEHQESLAFLTTAYHPWEVSGGKVGSLVTRALPIGGEGVPLFEVRQILETVRPLESA
ncbi:MAG TPA: ATP-binding protein [Actinocrinis sp.]|nr:ATP-binding protein [Actinocrinis sp.]